MVDMFPVRLYTFENSETQMFTRIQKSFLRSQKLTGFQNSQKSINAQETYRQYPDILY